MLINGEPVDGELGVIRFDERRAAIVGPSPTREPVGRYEVELVQSTGKGFADFLEQLERELYGIPRRDAVPAFIRGTRGNSSSASFVTLVRRERYGGRKGRRARARMIRGIFGPTPIDMKLGERHELAFGCPFPIFKRAEGSTP
jgi:hypothetical protein